MDETMKNLTVRKLTVTGALVLVAALLASLFSGAAYTETRSDPSGCSGCSLACAACVACTACTCLSCAGDSFDFGEYVDFEENFDDYEGLNDYLDDYLDVYSNVDDDSYSVGDTIELD